MRIILRLRFLVVVCLFTTLVFSQTRQHNFRSISVDKGLSQSTVYAITQDTLGFMWMATQDGLNRYNGESFSVYHPDDKNPQSLRSNYIRSLFVDHNGQLWIGGDKGISRYNNSSDQFQNYQPVRKPGDWYISCIAEDASGTIWAGSSAGEIFQADPSKNELKPYPFEAAGAGIRSISSLCYFQQSLYAGTDAGLFKFVNGSNQIEKVALVPGKQLINDMFIDGLRLWVGTEGNGLFCLDESKRAIEHYTAAPSQEKSLPNNDVRCIKKDARGNIWIGTFRGLSILDPKTGNFENYAHQPATPYSISQNSVRCLYQDKQQGMWLGTFYGGVNYYHPDDIKFNLLNQNSGKLSLNDQVVNVIKEDGRGNFWIGTNDKGLNYWNRQTNTIDYYSYNESGHSELSSNNVKSIVFDDQGKLLVGTHNAGLDILDPVSRRVTVLRHDENNQRSISGDMVYALLKDDKSRIWVGTRTGLDLFDPASQDFNHIVADKAGKRLSSNEIAYLFQDSRGRIWAGTTNGVTWFLPDNPEFAVFPGSMLSNEVVNCIAEDKKNRIWIGTRNGLNLFDESRQSFITSSDRPELLKGTIYGIIADEENNLWITTNRGIACLNPDTKSLQWYDSKDGLQSNQFNLYAFCKASDGMLLFGGINGISYFYPSTIRQQQLQLKVSFTGLEVLNKAINPDDGSGILSVHIDKTNSLELAHDQKQFTIVFNAFNYISAGRTSYQYKLDGFDADWQQADLPKASYRNLPSGKYVLAVRAIGPNGETSPVRTLKITILAPWYATKLFYFLVLVLIASGSYFTYRILFERKRTLQQLKMERMERDKLDYFNQVKTDFFTNVSHELRTPLTLILAPLEEMMRKPTADKQLGKQYKTMFLNARRLYQLVNQLFEFRKTEMGTRKLQVSKADLVHFTHEIHSSFQPLAETNRIRFEYNSTEAGLTFFFDKDAMEKILFNLLSNAFKYTAAGGLIKIDLSKNESEAIISVTDTGQGIAQEHIDKIFDRYYQVNNAEMNLGSGVGLAFTKRLVELHHGQISVQSRFGEGSSFTVTIPLADEVYQADEHSASQVYDSSPTPAEKDVVAFNAMQDDPDETTAASEAQTGPVRTGEMEKLLIVDDNHDIVDYLSTYFGSMYAVQTAYDGKQALEMLESQQVDLVICDVMMPEMDGLHFCKRVKKNIQTSHIPVILLTAKTETGQQIKGLEMGADDYMTKPFSINLLEAKVQGILRSRRRLREYYLSSKEVIPEKVAFNSMDEEFLKNAIAIVETNLSEPDFSVDKFSREIGMSRSNLYLKLKAITGESVTDFIKRIRFKKAVELLEERRHTIAEIAYMSGFNSPSYFSTAFKQYYDCMPTEYLAKKQLGKKVIE
ncbi:MAG: two-component regulator propeller domain-containing protein [Bacteroidota bacterium]